MSDTRSKVMEINAEFARILKTPQFINAGSASCDGVGDTMHVGLEKIRKNLTRIKAQYTGSPGSDKT